jgi:DNA-binding transcriptional regulator YiaG
MCMKMFAREGWRCDDGDMETKKVQRKKGLSPRKGTGNRALVYQGAETSTSRVQDLCQRYKLVRPDLTRLTGYSLRSVDKWAAGDQPSTAARKQLQELTRLLTALAEVMEPSYVGQWMKDPNEAFQGSTPLQVIERGESDRIWRMVYRVQTGEPM